jgi:hypothetical protein
MLLNIYTDFEKGLRDANFFGKNYEFSNRVLQHDNVNYKFLEVGISQKYDIFLIREKTSS